MCPAIHIKSRSLLRPSSIHEPSDPPLRVVLTHRGRPFGGDRDGASDPPSRPSLASADTHDSNTQKKHWTSRATTATLAPPSDAPRRRRTAGRITGSFFEPRYRTCCSRPTDPPYERGRPTTGTRTRLHDRVAIISGRTPPPSPSRSRLARAADRRPRRRRRPAAPSPSPTGRDRRPTFAHHLSFDCFVVTRGGDYELR